MTPARARQLLVEAGVLGDNDDDSDGGAVAVVQRVERLTGWWIARSIDCSDRVEPRALSTTPPRMYAMHTRRRQHEHHLSRQHGRGPDHDSVLLHPAHLWARDRGADGRQQAPLACID